MNSAHPDADFKQQLVGLIPNLRAFASSLCGNRALADDLVQECLMKAWAAQDSFQMGTNMKAWAFRILHNHYISFRRKRKRETEDPDGAQMETLTTRADQLDKIYLKDLSRLLMLLPESQREALILVGAGGFSYEEAADICGCAVGTIKSRVNRARAQLAEMMEGDERGNGTGGDFASIATVP